MAKTAAALHILVKEEKLALDLLEQIKNGADFGKLAKKHSICPSGKNPEIKIPGFFIISGTAL